MSLLREIQDAAIDSKTDLASLLRKCKVLAVRLGSEEFKSWVDSELSGYKKVEDLPEYRILPVTSKGHFYGANNRSWENIDIPLTGFPKEIRETLSQIHFTESVASLEALVINSVGGNPMEQWNPDFVARVGAGIYRNMMCMQAWKVIPIPALIGTLNEIRSRILNFVLEIEIQDLDAGEAAQNSIPVPPEKITHIFHTHINGNVGNVATGSHSFKQNAVTSDTNAELFSQLLEALQSLEQPEITTTLANNVEEMRSTQGTESFKEHYQHFMTLLSNHMTVLGPAVAPFLPALAAMGL